MQEKCAEADCEKWAKWRGLCQRHYIADQYRDKPPPTDEELANRIFPKVIEDPGTNCWEWQGARHARYGHGMFGYNALGRNTTRYVHDWMWEFLVGPVPEGLVLDHLCRNTRCCNPVHLEPVTSEENILRGDGPTAVNARKTHCIHGHEFTPENTRMQRQAPSSGGTWMRVCKTCARDKARKYAKARRNK